METINFVSTENIFIQIWKSAEIGVGETEWEKYTTGGKFFNIVCTNFFLPALKVFVKERIKFIVTFKT